MTGPGWTQKLAFLASVSLATLTTSAAMAAEDAKSDGNPVLEDSEHSSQ